VTHCEYTLSVCLTRDGQVIGRREVSAGAAIEDAVFRALLAGRVSNGGDAPEVRVEPEWSTTGLARVSALRVFVADDERRYGAAMFREQAGAIARELSAAGKLGREESARWSLRAERRERRGLRRATVRRAPLPLVARSLPAVEPGEMDVAIAESVLAELRAHMETRPGEEVAGLLTGRLVHDRERGAACLEVSGYHPLRAGAGGTSRLHFALDSGFWRLLQDEA